MAHPFFVTGTDTGVGKTYFTQWLIRSWRKLGYEAMGLKPITTGGREDAILINEAVGGIHDISTINPYHFKEPAAPLVAAEAEGIVIDRDELSSRISAQVKSWRERGAWLAIEGAGGWRVPIGKNYEMRDLARDLGVPVVVVALNKLGMLNHTLLTVESVRNHGCECAGLVINQGENGGKYQDKPELLALESNARCLRDLLPGTLPIFELDSAAQATIEIPLWLGGK